jgi:hypothetical protein
VSTEIFALQPFEAVAGTVTVALTRASYDWQLEYVLDPVGQELKWIAPMAAGGGHRVDGLWRETCCELFVAGAVGEAYLEFNFSPAGDWAAYAFDGPRQGMRAHRWSGAEPRVERLSATHPLALRAHLPIAALYGGTVTRVAFSAVMKTVDSVSHWALQHPGAQPDFHHPDSFILLPNVSRS